MNIDTQVFDPYYGDYLNINEIKHLSYNLFPDVFCGDIALKIIQCMDFTTLGKLGKLAQSWNKISNHIFAEKRVILYKQIFNPEDCNHYFKEFPISLKKMKKAFKSLPPTINEHSSSIYVEKYAIAWIPKGLFFKQAYDLAEDSCMTLPDPYQNLTASILEKFENIRIQKSYFIAITRDVLPESCKKSPAIQEGLIKTLNQVSARVHRVPALIEMFVLIAAERVKFKNFLLGMYGTRCIEKFSRFDDEDEHHLAVMSSRLFGVDVYCPSINQQTLGMATVTNITGTKKQ